MFTQHGKGWTGLSTPAPAPADQQIGVASPTSGKGRAVPRRISDLEKELHQYQHSMGLLLIDKQEMAAKYDQFSQAYAQSKEILKREQAAHLNAISEYEKREESIRNALYVEKQCVADLKKALREVRSEIAEVKLVSQKKIGDVHSLQANIDEKPLLIEKKLNVADAKLAEANLTVSYADKKIKEIEARQCRYEKEKLCYETQWKAQDNKLKDKEESLHDWEKRLKESQNRQVNLQRSLIGWEEKVNVNDKILKMRLEELQEAKQTVENTNETLKVEEYGINNRLHKLHAYEMDIKFKYKTLEKKEELLADWEDRINMKEKKLTKDQKACQESKIEDFEFVMRMERESLTKEMQKIINNLQWREKDVKSKEGDLLKSEQELNWNTEMLDNWKHDLDSRSQALKKLEEALNIDDKKMTEKMLLLENERKDIDRYKQDLERTMSSIEAEKHSLKEKEILKLAKEDRNEHSRKLVELKQEIEGYRVEGNSLSREADDLRQQKLKLEKAWEDLDMKKAYAEEEAKKISYERTKIERFHDSENLRLKDVELKVGAEHKRRMEDIRLKEETFMCDIEQQKLQNNQLLEGERADIQRSFDLHRHKLEMEMEQKQVTKEQELEFKHSELNKKLSLVENEMRSAVELNGSKIQKIIFEKKELENEKSALVKDQQRVETEKTDIKEDIDRLNMLSKSLKEGREAYKKEKNHLIGLIDKYKECKSCRVPVFDESDKDSTGTHYPNFGIEGDDHFLNTEPLPHGTGGLADSSGHFTPLQKCSGLFRCSPSMKAGHPLGQKVSFGAKLDSEASEHEEDYDPSRVYEVATDSFAFSQETPSDSRGVETEQPERISFGESGSFSFSIRDNILKTQSGDTNSSMEFDANITLNDGTGNESSDTPQGVMHTNQQKREGRLRGVKRTRTMQAVIKEAKMLIGPISEDKHNDQKDYVAASAGSTEQCEEKTEVYFDGDPLGGARRKRQQLGSTAMQVPGENRYNLRHNRVVNAVTSSKTRSGKTRGMKAGRKRKIEVSSGDDARGASTCGIPAAQISTDSGEAKVQESSHIILLTEVEEARPPVGNASKNDGDTVNGKASVPDSVPSTPSGSDLGAEDGDEDDRRISGRKRIGQEKAVDILHHVSEVLELRWRDRLPFHSCRSG